MKVALAEAARHLEHAYANGEPLYEWVDGRPDSNNWIDYYDTSWNLIGAVHDVVFHRKSRVRQLGAVPLFDRDGITVADVERAPIGEVFGFIIAVNATERICDGLYRAYLDSGVAAAAAGRIRRHLARIARGSLR